MNRLPNIARIATVAMCIMISVILLSFFVKSKWITIIWVAAAVVCVICMVIVAYNKNR